MNERSGAVDWTVSEAHQVGDEQFGSCIDLENWRSGRIRGEAPTYAGEGHVGWTQAADVG